MPIYEVPREITEFVVVRGEDGGFAIADAGRPPGRFFFAPCRDEAQAEQLCALLNAGQHDGTIMVELFSLPASKESE